MCNHYLVRNPHIQEALGRALARSTMMALEAYVDSISLSTQGGEGRDAVTSCLTVFRGCADQQRRRVLWKRAFERWRAWDFDANDKETGISEIARGELDYAVVGWLVEGQPPEAGSNPDTEFEEGLRALDMGWQASINVAVSTFFRLLSRHQVGTHAREKSINDADWLPGPTIYAPPAAIEPFVQRRYHWGWAMIVGLSGLVCRTFAACIPQS